MKKVFMTIFSVLLSIFIIGYAGIVQSQIKPKPENLEEVAQKHPEAFFKAPLLGVSCAMQGSEVVIESVSPNSAAERAGIRVGDVMVSIDNIPIKSPFQPKQIIQLTKEGGQNVSCSIKRDNNIFLKQVTLDTNYVYFDCWVLIKKLIEGKPIRLAVITGEITHTLSNQMGQESFSQWQKGIESGLIINTEALFVRFNSYKNFELIDRQHINKVLNELKLQQSGLASDASSLKLGKMLGATHLLIISYTRFQQPGSKVIYQDAHYRKLIDVESGKILSSFQMPLENNGVSSGE